MTVNERLFVLGLIAEWEEAVSTRDRAAMIAMMLKAEVVPPEPTVDAVLADPGKYSF